MVDSSTKRQRQEQRHAVRQKRLAVDPGVSAQSSTRLRRRCVLAASTGDDTRLDNDGVVERLSATNQRRRRRSARCPLTTGYVDSAAYADQLHATAMTVHCRQRTNWVNDAGSGHAHSSHGFKQRHQSTIYSTKRPFMRTDNFKLLGIVRFSSDVEINSMAHACRSQRPGLRQSVKNSAQWSRRNARSGSKCRYKRIETTET